MAIVKLKTPSEDFESIIRIIRFSSSICGIDLLKPNYRMNWITYTLFMAIAVYYTFVFLTVWRNYQDEGNIFLRVSVTLGTACQGCIKLFAFLYNKDVVFDLYKKLSDIFREYEKLGDKYRDALQASLQKTRKGVFSLTAFCAIGYVGVALVPYVWFLVTAEKTLVIEFHVPGLDITTTRGYFATLGFQSVFVIGCAFGLYCGDLVPLVYLLQSFMFSYIFAAKIEGVNEMVKDPNNNNKPSVSLAIRDIIKWLQIFSKMIFVIFCSINSNRLHFSYTMTCNNLFYYIITVQIGTAFFSTVLSIYMIMAGGWPGAYSYVVIAFCSLYLYCILGSENQSANDKFENDIYNIRWYNLNDSQQKLILQVLCQTQKPQIIDVAGIMPLSVSTALQITKTVYSMTMVMIQMFSQ